MIILIRHAQSEGNKNREIHQTVPDHRVNLTPEGHRQAHEAGSRLRELLRPDDTLHFFTSPYRRTRETTEGLMSSLTSDDPSPSPFPRHTIKVYEEPRLREQDFGNFQPCSAEMERMWLERADYGHFFYRIPNGESAADAYDRVSGFNESLWRLFGEDDFASVCVLVTHGLMTRVFLMKWYHWSVEYFEDLRNINHCEFVILKLNPDNGKYVLQNNLRTWSEMKKEKELKIHQERASKGLGPAPISSEPPVPARRRWGGCPDGCNHGIRRRTSTRNPRPNGADAMRHDHHEIHKKIPDTNALDPAQEATAKVEQLKAAEHPPDATNPDSDNDNDNGHESHTTSNPKSTTTTNPENQRPSLSHFHQDSEDSLLDRQRHNLALLRLGGRDGGGSMSGFNSLNPSEDEREEPTPLKILPRQISHQARPSQDIGNDGDDEGSESKPGLQRLRRARSHNHHHHHHHNHFISNINKRNLAVRIGDTLGDRDLETDDTDHLPNGRETSLEPEPEPEGEPENTTTDERIQEQENEDDTFEAERRRDQSIRGSVY